MTAQTVTITLSRDDAWWIKNGCSDAANYWHGLYQQTADGERSDLDPESCERINRRYHRLWQLLHDAGAVA
jgi:uncharacterized protein VirK/YbjX